MNEKKIIAVNDIMIGSDIEAFLRDKETGKFISAIGRIGGSKAYPKPLDKEGCCIQEDNVALEYNVPPVTLNDSKEMYSNIKYVLDTVKALESIPENLEITCCSSAVFANEELNHPQAQEFGCEPDFNAWWGGDQNPRPNADNVNLRSCGGHIHISYPNADEDTSMALIRLFDLFLGIPSLFVDTDIDRRKLYGKAGAFRFKQWGSSAGFEYRTMSNWWTKDEETVNWLFESIKAAIEYFNTGESPIEIDGEAIITAINENNLELAQALCAKYNLNIPANAEIEA